LGALPPEEEQGFVAELLANGELRDLVRDLEAAASLVTRGAPSVELPAHLKGKVMQQIDAEESAKKSRPEFGAALAGLNFISAGRQTGWKPLPIPGTFIQLLSIERERGYAVLLGKLAPGARYPAHVNAGPEDFYILTGDLVVGSLKLVAGDFHHADQGSKHEENYSIEGCTLLAVLTTDDPLVAFAMS
jgi:hypothetical protein